MSPRQNSLVSSSGSGRKVRQLREPRKFHKSLCESCGEAQRKRMLLRREWAAASYNGHYSLDAQTVEKRRGLPVRAISYIMSNCGVQPSRSVSSTRNATRPGSRACAPSRDYSPISQNLQILSSEPDGAGDDGSLACRR